MTGDRFAQPALSEVEWARNDIQGQARGPVQGQIGDNILIIRGPCFGCVSDFAFRASRFLILLAHTLTFNVRADPCSNVGA
jgi:hypothetical protein